MHGGGLFRSARSDLYLGPWLGSGLCRLRSYLGINIARNLAAQDTIGPGLLSHAAASHALQCTPRGYDSAQLAMLGSGCQGHRRRRQAQRRPGGPTGQGEPGRGHPASERAVQLWAGGRSVATTAASTPRRGQLDGVLLRPAHASSGSLVASFGGEHRD